MNINHLLTVLSALSILGCDGNPPADTPRATFTNPIIADGADPWVIRHQGFYYYCFSREDRIYVSRSTELHKINQDSAREVWAPPPGTDYSHELWAPELHYLDGHWYIYVAADDGDNAHHRIIVLAGSGPDPQVPFVYQATLRDPADCWAIDGTVLTGDSGQHYFIWSGWEGSVNVCQNLYIAPLSNPWTISGNRVLISRPEYAWEKTGNPLVNEGPQILRNGDRLFIIYSASGSWTDDYCLGQLTFTGTDPLDPAAWVKKSTPVFSGTEQVFGPGHASFVKSPDGQEDWIVYHAAKSRGSGWERDIRIQRFTWLEDGSPNFGEPVPARVSLPVPSGGNP